MHLIYKDEEHKRDWRNQIKRFHLLKYAKKVLSGMSYHQEYLEEICTVKQKNYGKTILVPKVAKYWGFIAVIDNKIRIKYVLRQIGNGNIILWSVIPYWETKDYKGIKTNTLHKGDLLKD